MAAELQQPGSPANTVGAASVAAPTTAENPGPALAPKRHRRPSVRLGDIGDQSATVRTSKPWRLNPPREPNPGKTSKTRHLTNLVTPNGTFNPHSDYSTDAATTPCDNGNAHRKLPKEFKPRRTTITNTTKRVRTPHLTIDQALAADQAPQETQNAGNNYSDSFHDDDDDDDVDVDDEGFRDFVPEDSEQEQQSPADEGALLDAWHRHNRRSVRAAGAGSTRISDSHQDLGLDGFGFGLGLELDDGVRNWLLGLGLGRYAPVFEIHEVDDEVLPHLTLEDLKDMGINAVGSRRKLYSAIQKLHKPLL